MNEKQLTEAYERDENMMILVFAQWCVNHDLDPMELYAKAYPQQKLNESLKKPWTIWSCQNTKQSTFRPDCHCGEMFGNTDLAQALHEAISGRKQ